MCLVCCGYNLIKGSINLELGVWCFVSVLLGWELMLYNLKFVELICMWNVYEFGGFCKNMYIVFCLIGSELYGKYSDGRI